MYCQSGHRQSTVIRHIDVLLCRPVCLRLLPNLSHDVHNNHLAGIFNAREQRIIYEKAVQQHADRSF